MLQRRRLSSVQLVLVSILLCSSVYLWTKKIHPFRYDDSVVVYKSDSGDVKDNEVIETPAASGSAEEPADSNPPALPLADPSESEADASNQESLPCSQAATTESSELEPEAFPQFNFDLSAETDDNRTLLWLDLWSDDANCTRHQVRLLPDDSVPDPGALVSFPGSGNSWLRMLLMGATGIFIRSVYDGDDSLFQSKGE